MSFEIRNAEIIAVKLSNVDHGCLSLWLTLDYGGAGQGFGGYNLYNKPTGSKSNKGICGWFLWRIFETLDITDYHQIEGQRVRAEIEDGLVVAIGHFMKNQWFNPGKELKEYEEES